MACVSSVRHCKVTASQEGREGRCTCSIEHVVSGFGPPWSQTSQVYNLACPLTDGETWGELPNLGLLQFPPPQMGLIIILKSDCMQSQGINTAAFSATVPRAVSTPEGWQLLPQFAQVSRFLPVSLQWQSACRAAAAFTASLWMSCPRAGSVAERSQLRPLHFAQLFSITTLESEPRTCSRRTEMMLQ